MGLGDMDPESFRRHGHALVEWAARYLETVPGRPPLAAVEPGALTAALPPGPPAGPEPMAAMVADLDRLVVPALTHWNHPRFFAYFNSTGSGPGILGEWLTAAFNVNAMLWRSAPAATELEGVATRWLGELCGLPSSWDGHINDTASTSTLVALAAAREALGLEVRSQGLAGRPELPRLRVYASDQAHSSVEKAVITLGLGQAGLRTVASDAAFRMVPEALARAIAEDRRAGWRPMAVVATCGTTSTASVDPLPAIAEIAAAAGCWLHVDAAYGGALAAVPEHRGVLDGADRADSLVINPHKWLFVPVDCSVLFTRHPDLVRGAFSLVPDYLRTPPAAGQRNLMDYGPALGRRFRALKLWMVLRYFGAEGIAARLREHVRLARWLAAALEARPGWELTAPASMAVVCFRHRPAGVADETDLAAHNQALMDHVNRSGAAFISHTVLAGRFSLRVAVGHIRTTQQDVAILLAALEAAAADEAVVA